MQQLDTQNHADPLDVLRRFIPTPLKAMYRIGAARVMVETNDFNLLPELPLDADFNDPGVRSLQWKLIRDKDSPGLLEQPVFLTSGTLTVVEMGTACLVGLDHERRELLGFIGADIDTRTYHATLVPFLCRMTNELLSGDSVLSFKRWSEESANA